MKEQLMNILEELKPAVDFETETKLIEDGVLDSFDMVSLIGELNDAFDIEISFDDIEPENFNSADAILSLIKRLAEEE